MYARIVAAIVIALAFAGTYWKGHTSGAKAVQTLWDADVAQRTAQALQAEIAARKKEQELQSKVRSVSDAYRTARENTNHLAAAASDGLRNLETILSAPAIASSGATASGGNHGAGSVERELLGSCAATLARMGQEADRMALKVVTLQEYIRAISKNP